MKVTFLRAGESSSHNHFSSNLLIESGNLKLCIDCGRSAFGAVEQYGLSLKDITHILITHLHYDCIGGLEEAAFMTKFVHKFKVKLMATPSLLEHLWQKCLRGGLEHIEEAPGDQKAHTLDNYYDLIELPSQKWYTIENDLPLNVFLHPTNHIKGMESYGVEVETQNGSLTKRFLYSGDTKFSPELIHHGTDTCSYVFQDCQTLDQKRHNLLHHHTSYHQLLKLPLKKRDKIWLCHNKDAPLPDVKKDGFGGFIKHLQSFTL